MQLLGATCEEKRFYDFDDVHWKITTPWARGDGQVNAGSNIQIALSKVFDIHLLWWVWVLYNDPRVIGLWGNWADMAASKQIEWHKKRCILKNPIILITEWYPAQVCGIRIWLATSPWCHAPSTKILNPNITVSWWYWYGMPNPSICEGACSVNEFKHEEWSV